MRGWVHRVPTFRPSHGKAGRGHGSVPRRRRAPHWPAWRRLSPRCRYRTGPSITTATTRPSPRPTWPRRWPGSATRPPKDTPGTSWPGSNRPPTGHHGPARAASARLDLSLALIAAGQHGEAAGAALEAITSGRIVPSNYWWAREVIKAIDGRGLSQARELAEAYRGTCGADGPPALPLRGPLGG